MGYIIPVERFQYNDYHNRQVDNKQHVESVHPAFKTILDKKHEEVGSEYQRLMPSSYKTIPLKPQMTAAEHNAFAEITGKGSMINESV